LSYLGSFPSSSSPPNSKSTIDFDLNKSSEVGMLTFKVRKSQNLQILGLIPLSPIRKFLKCASPLIANPQIGKSAKISLFCTHLNWSIICYTSMKKKFVFAEKPAKRLRPQINQVSKLQKFHKSKKVAVLSQKNERKLYF